MSLTWSQIPPFPATARSTSPAPATSPPTAPPSNQKISGNGGPQQRRTACWKVMKKIRACWESRNNFKVLGEERAPFLTRHWHYNPWGPLNWSTWRAMMRISACRPMSRPRWLRCQRWRWWSSKRCLHQRKGPWNYIDVTQVTHHKTFVLQLFTAKDPNSTVLISWYLLHCFRLM